MKSDEREWNVYWSKQNRCFEHAKGEIPCLQF
jgi:hypothetical protein